VYYYDLYLAQEAIEKVDCPLIDQVINHPRPYQNLWKSAVNTVSLQQGDANTSEGTGGCMML